jgi:hypothetical protein
MNLSKLTDFVRLSYPPELIDTKKREATMYRIALCQHFIERYGMVWHEIAFAMREVMGRDLNYSKTAITTYRRKHWELLRTNDKYNEIYKSINN